MGEAELLSGFKAETTVAKDYNWTCLCTKEGSENTNQKCHTTQIRYNERRSAAAFVVPWTVSLGRRTCSCLVLSVDLARKFSPHIALVPVPPSPYSSFVVFFVCHACIHTTFCDFTPAGGNHQIIMTLHSGDAPAWKTSRTRGPCTTAA